MTKKYNFKTQRGAQVEVKINVEHITKEMISLDGNEFETDCNKYQYSVADVRVNGKSYKGEIHDLAMNIRIGYQGNQPILIALPEEVKKDIKAEESAEAEARVERMMKGEKEYQRNYNKVINAMAE